MAEERLREKPCLWIDPNKPLLNEEAMKLLKEEGIEFEIIEISNPDGDTYLPAFFPNKEGEAPASSLEEIHAYVRLRNNHIKLRKMLAE
jgi:hypothetical protein